jgi:ADP-ribose pyrophosphatase YjhB (NUDIX family)
VKPYGFTNFYVLVVTDRGQQRVANMLNAVTQLIHRIHRLYWWLMRPQTHGVRGLVFNEQDEILLVRHRYIKGCYLPGGRVGRREAPLDALKREIREETGLSHLTIERKLGTYQSEQEYKRDTIDVFVARCSGMIQFKPNIEIQQAQFFPLSELPSDVTPATRRRLAEYRGESSIEGRW